MGGVIDGGVEISSTPSSYQLSDLEKTQTELRETFNTAEKFRRELEFLQKGGDPLDLKVRTAASSTSLTDQHPEQFVTSEVKGSFAITTSPHGDSVESSGRLGCEPNSADNLMLFDGNNKFHDVENIKDSGESFALELPKKSYKRRIRSKPNRHHSRDTKEFDKLLSNSNSTPKNITPISNNLLEVKSNGIQETLVSISSIEPVSSFEHPPRVDPHTVDDVALLGQTKGFDQTDQSLDGDNKNEVPNIRTDTSNGNMEMEVKETPNMEGNDVISVKDDKLLNINNDNNETGIDSDVCTTSEVEKKPLDTTLCSENNIKLATKEYEDSILEEARIIEEKRKRIAGLSVGIMKQESNHRSHWHFVLEEMSWLANDFAHERIWKVTIAAQISQKAAYTSRIKFQNQNSLWKQKEIAHILAKSVMEFWHTIQMKCHNLELKGSKKDCIFGLDKYGMKFLEYNSFNVQAPVTPDRISDLGISEFSWEDNLTEENLFYIVPPGAIEAYRKSIESRLLQFERTRSSMQEEMDADNNTLEEDEGETSTYYLPGAFEGSRMSKTTQKKRKQSQPFKSYIPKSYDSGANLSFPQPSGKRPVTSINVSIPTKRVRTASRPRFTGTSGYINNNNNNNNEIPNRRDASSGDTNSFQDEESCLHGGYNQIQNNNNMEAESVGDYEKQLHFDMTEVSNRPKKKKKGSTFDHRWQLDSNFQNDQKEHLKRRLDTRQFDSNGNSVASQMSNMSNSNKFMKLLVRDRGRKAKLLKTPIGQQGSGSPWSLFEDQALVVLVHDLGANWELISDAINSTLQFKCISRNSKECKNRHKMLMDRNSGDGADSAEDSGSSQPYPSTLPGIPEGSARQLFQRLQGPIEEDTLKSHFEKIIIISKKHHKKSHKDNQDPKQLQQPHGSHTLALSQFHPNNLNGGPVLTPLDLCEPVSSTPDFVPVKYQVPISPVWEGRYGIPRNMQPSSGLHPDHGVRMLPGGNGMSSVNRGIMMTRPSPPNNSNSQGGTTQGVPAYSFQQPPVPPYQISTHMPSHLQGPQNNSPFGMRLMKERQLQLQQQQQQQRIRQQQQFATSNPVSPHGGRPLAAKVMKEKGTPGDQSVANGFVTESGGGPSGVNVNVNPLVVQKRFPGQPQQKSKLVSQSQLTHAQKIILQNRKANPSDLHARGVSTMPITPLTKLPSSDDVAPGNHSQ